MILWIIVLKSKNSRKLLYNSKRGNPFESPLDINYLFTKLFVTVPSSVVTRTKYMPLARP